MDEEEEEAKTRYFPQNPWALHGKCRTRHLCRGPGPKQTLSVGAFLGFLGFEERTLVPATPPETAASGSSSPQVRPAMSPKPLAPLCSRCFGPQVRHRSPCDAGRSAVSGGSAVLRNMDEETTAALLNFSYHLACGNTDEVTGDWNRFNKGVWSTSKPSAVSVCLAKKEYYDDLGGAPPAIGVSINSPEKRMFGGQDGFSA